jgi:hypothetical protein
MAASGRAVLRSVRGKGPAGDAIMPSGKQSSKGRSAS